jgi:hypothetical protein
MSRARSSIAGFALLVAAQALAAENSAPLESTKQELRQLEAAQKNKSAPATPDGMKVLTPALEAAAPENPVIQQWTDRKKAEERVEKQKQRKSENWLVNGMEQLGRDGAGTTDVTTTDSEGMSTQTGVVDTSDPGYLLKLFDEQKKHDDGKEASAKTRSAPAPDPFAPFLQNWLGNSPVKGQVLEQFRRANESGGAPVIAGRPEDYRGPDASLTAVATPATTPANLSTAPKPNPYLVDLTPLPATPGLSAGTPPAAALDRTLSTPVPVVTPSPATPLPETRAPAKGPPPSPADEKKYFPQLNRF